MWGMKHKTKKINKKKKKTQKESQKSVHVNITLPLSQIMRRIQVSHWYYCRYKAPAEEIKTIKSPVQSQVKTERERKEKKKKAKIRKWRNLKHQKQNKKQKNSKTNGSGSHFFLYFDKSSCTPCPDRKIKKAPLLFLSFHFLKICVFVCVELYILTRLVQEEVCESFRRDPTGISAHLTDRNGF